MNTIRMIMHTAVRYFPIYDGYEAVNTTDCSTIALVEFFRNFCIFNTDKIKQAINDDAIRMVDGNTAFVQKDPDSNRIAITTMLMGELKNEFACVMTPPELLALIDAWTDATHKKSAYIILYRDKAGTVHVAGCESKEAMEELMSTLPSWEINLDRPLESTEK